MIIHYKMLFSDHIIHIYLYFHKEFLVPLLQKAKNIYIYIYIYLYIYIYIYIYINDCSILLQNGCL